MTLSFHLVKVIALVCLFFLLLIVVAHVLHGKLLIAVVQLGHLLFSFEVAIESEQLRSEVGDDFDLP